MSARSETYSICDDLFRQGINGQQLSPRAALQVTLNQLLRFVAHPSRDQEGNKTIGAGYEPYSDDPLITDLRNQCCTSDDL